MANTTATEVIQNFQSTFQDKKVLPEGLELMWLKKANGRYSIELEPLNFDNDLQQYDKVLDQYVIDTLAEFMKQLYQEREVSRINKIASIVTKDISIDGMGNNKKFSSEELKYISDKAQEMVENQKPTAYV
jgi:hypothetical protein